MAIHDFKGNFVSGAGKFYSMPIILQHRNHFTKVVFEIIPLEPEVDAFLPYWWIAKTQTPGSMGLR